MNEKFNNEIIQVNGAESEPIYLAQKVLEKAKYEGEHKYLQVKHCAPCRTYSIDAEECSIKFYSTNKNHNTIALQGNLLLIPLVDKNDMELPLKTDPLFLADFT